MGSICDGLLKKKNLKYSDALKQASPHYKKNDWRGIQYGGLNHILRMVTNDFELHFLNG